MMLLRPMLGLGVYLLCLALALTANVWVWGRFVVRPALRLPTNRQVALYIEEHAPDLEDRLNSAVEAGSATDDPVIAGLLADASSRIKGIAPSRVVRRLRERLLTYGSMGGIAALLVLVVANWQSFRLVALETSLPGVAARQFLTVTPGNVDIKQGEGQQVVARLRSEYGGEVFISYDTGDGQWLRNNMEPGSSGRSFLWEFLDIQAPINYFVQAGNRRSDVFQISLHEFPSVTRIDVTYRYPGYTGLPDRTEEDNGDIEGPAGSDVTVHVHVTETATKAAMVMESGTTVELRRRMDGVYRGALAIRKEDSYAIVVTDAAGNTNRFPAQYLILPIPDSAPRIAVRDPGRDIRASVVEEVLVAADSGDDYGITSFAMRYSINGEEEQEVDLLDGREGLSISGETLLFLEDHAVEPGDVISYYAKASDALREEVTDMYFIEVRPFDQSFRQVANAGDMQGAQRQSGLVVSQQEIIAATWRLLRHRDEDVNSISDLESVVQAQDNLRSEISERIASTALSLELRASSEQRRVVEYLEQAITEMGRAVELLRDGNLREALTPERRALTFLLRADAQNTERQVAQQSGGGGASATEERMSELMDLELDISKNKYETQQQSPTPDRNDAMDQAMQRVKDLARRQQSLAENTDGSQMQGQNRRRFVDRLQRDQDALRRQVEQLSQALQSSASESTQRRLDRTAHSMSQAQRALRRDDIEEAVERQQQALDDLQQLEQDIQTASRGSLRQRIKRLEHDLAMVTEREQQLARELADAAVRQEHNAEGMARERNSILKETERALSEARELEYQALDQDQRVATALRNLQLEATKARLLDAMDDSREALENGWIDAANRVESGILEAMEQLREPRTALTDGLPVIEEEGLLQTLNQIEALRNELEQLDVQAGRAESGIQQALRARIQQQMERTQGLVQRLRRNNPGNDAMQQTLRGIQNALARADHTGILLDEGSAKAFFDDNFMAPITRLQLEIRQRLDYLQLSRPLFGGRREDVPPEYQAMVEKYFESLSRRATAQ